MSKHTLSLRLSFGVCLLAGLVAFGCKEKPAVPFSEYGETIDHLPVVEDLPTAFPIADEIETKPCVIREQAEERAHHHLLESQGRGMELELEHRQKEEARRASQRAAQEKAAAEAAEPEITPPAEEAALETAAPEAEAPAETAAPAEEAPAETAAPEAEAPAETAAPEAEAPAEPTAGEPVSEPQK